MLEGSVQRAAGKVRVHAQLIDARSDKHLWGQTYDRALADVFTIETEVAQTIANELQAQLSPNEKVSIEQKPTRDIAAYDFYIRAIPLIEPIAYSSTPEKDLRTAVDLLSQAVMRDPSFLLAHFRLALAHDQIYFQGIDRTPARLALAQSAIDSVFRLKPDSGEGHFALASHLYNGYFDFDRARGRGEQGAGDRAQRGLAHPVGARHLQHLSRRKPEAEAAEQHAVITGDSQLASFEHGDGSRWAKKSAHYSRVSQRRQSNFGGCRTAGGAA